MTSLHPELMVLESPAKPSLAALDAYIVAQALFDRRFKNH